MSANPALLTMPTPAGPLGVITDDGVVTAAGFDTPRALARRLGLPAVPPDAPTHHPLHAVLRRWIDGDAAALSDVDTRQDGTDFQHLVWNAMCTIPAGTTVSYGELAAAIDRPGATRAVGSACGANLLAPFVPCHRVVRADGSMGGYAFGPTAKHWLLSHERVHALGDV